MANLTMYERCLAGMERDFEEMVEELMGRALWMGMEERALFRQVWAWHWEMTVGDAALVDLEAMAGALWELKQRAAVGGNERWVWAFEQLYAWVCASLSGVEYHWPQTPEALAVWS